MFDHDRASDLIASNPPLIEANVAVDATATVSLSDTTAGIVDSAQLTRVVATAAAPAVRQPIATTESDALLLLRVRAAAAAIGRLADEVVKPLPSSSNRSFDRDATAALVALQSLLADARISAPSQLQPGESASGASAMLPRYFANRSASGAPVFTGSLAPMAYFSPAVLAQNALAPTRPAPAYFLDRFFKWTSVLLGSLALLFVYRCGRNDGNDDASVDLSTLNVPQLELKLGTTAAKKAQAHIDFDRSFRQRQELVAWKLKPQSNPIVKSAVDVLFNIFDFVLRHWIERKRSEWIRADNFMKPMNAAIAARKKRDGDRRQGTKPV
jgi:hypothetical protein